MVTSNPAYPKRSIGARRQCYRWIACIGARHNACNLLQGVPLSATYAEKKYQYGAASETVVPSMMPSGSIVTSKSLSTWCR